MNLDWFKLGLVAVAIWILMVRSKDGGTPIDWPELIALALIAQFVSAVWEVA